MLLVSELDSEFKEIFTKSIPRDVPQPSPIEMFENFLVELCFLLASPHTPPQCCALPVTSTAYAAYQFYLIVDLRVDCSVSDILKNSIIYFVIILADKHEEAETSCLQRHQLNTRSYGECYSYLNSIRSLKKYLRNRFPDVRVTQLPTPLEMFENSLVELCFLLAPHHTHHNALHSAQLVLSATTGSS